EETCAHTQPADRRNKGGTELATIARHARHTNADKKHRRHYREQWIRTYEELDTMNVIQITPITFAKKRWAIVDERGAQQFSSLSQGISAEKQMVLDRLEAVHFVPKFLGADGNGSSLDDIAQFLQTLTGVNF